MIEVVLVDEQGKNVGVMERMRAHQRPGMLHRAISIVLYRTNSKQKTEILLQRRSGQKPLWPKFWANTVCTHPLPGETGLGAAVRRLREEMGIVMRRGELKELYSFVYQEDYNQILSEHEFDTVIVGEYRGEYKLNLDEVMEARWMGWEELGAELRSKSEIYSPWPRMIFADERMRDEIG